MFYIKRSSGLFFIRRYINDEEYSWLNKHCFCFLSSCESFCVWISSNWIISSIGSRGTLLFKSAPPFFLHSYKIYVPARAQKFFSRLPVSDRPKEKNDRPIGLATGHTKNACVIIYIFLIGAMKSRTRKIQEVPHLWLLCIWNFEKNLNIEKNQQYVTWKCSLVVICKLSQILKIFIRMIAFGILIDFV